MVSSKARGTAGAGKYSNKKTKSKKSSASSRSAFLSKSKGAHLPTFSHQYEVQHNAKGSAFSSEFVVTQNLSPRSGAQLDGSVAHNNDAKLNSLSKAIMKSRQNQRPTGETGPDSFSNQPHSKVLPLK